MMHPGTLTLSPERQSAWVSKITNDGLTRSGTGCFIAVPTWQQWASKGYCALVVVEDGDGEVADVTGQESS